jgi:hypothetical protein
MDEEVQQEPIPVNIDPDPTTAPTPPEPATVVNRSGRVSRPPRSLTQDMIIYESIEDVSQVNHEINWMSPLAFAALSASSDPDVMYLHKALMQPDKAQFLKAMVEEVEGQTRNKNWILIERIHVPKRARILPRVWEMRRKRRILDGTVYKWKARLNVDGGKQIRGVDYWETYAPLAMWTTI